MSAVFLKIVNMSITASWLVLAVILVRLLLKKAPKWISCLLWGLVAIRLLCPFSLKSALSLVPSAETIPPDIALQHEPAIHSGISAVNSAINPAIADSFAPAPGDSMNSLQAVIPVLAALWVLGMAAMLAYALVSYVKLRKTVSACVPAGEDVYACDEICAPFILGVFRPAIYVPSSMSGETLSHVIAHEKAHLRRRDHWWKPLGYLLLAIHWFNPLCWITYILLCRDIEMACDERVIRDMDREEMAAYSQALLDYSLPRRRIVACPLAFGEVGVKERIRGILNYKKPAFWIVAAALILSIALAIGFLTDPKDISLDADASAQEKRLTLDDVRLLSKKGQALSWEDFEPYEGREVGSGLYILQYEIDDLFDVLVGGPNEYEEPWYIHLQDRVRNTYIDIRTDDIDAFVEAAQDAKQSSPEYIHTAVAYVNWAEDMMMRGCLNGEKMIISSARHLPVFKLDTPEDLARFREDYGDSLTLDQGYDEVPSFSEVTGAYDEAFFAEHTVLLAYVASSSGSFRYALQDIANSGAALCLNVTQTNDPETYTADMAGWLVMAEVKDEDIAGVTGFDAKLTGAQ